MRNGIEMYMFKVTAQQIYFIFLRFEHYYQEY